MWVCCFIEIAAENRRVFKCVPVTPGSFKSGFNVDLCQVKSGPYVIGASKGTTKGMRVRAQVNYTVLSRI